jgi:hypothetical protein
MKMRAYTATLWVVVLAMISAATAHVKIVYPALRGPNVSKDQVLFCGQYLHPLASCPLSHPSIHFVGGYNNTGTRVPFPLSNGFVLFTTGHPHWTGQSAARTDAVYLTHHFPQSESKFLPLKTPARSPTSTPPTAVINSLFPTSKDKAPKDVFP